MATAESVLALVVDAANEAAALAGQPTFSEQIMQLADELAQVKADNVALQDKLARAVTLAQEAIAADTVADQLENERLTGLLGELQ